MGWRHTIVGCLTAATLLLLPAAAALAQAEADPPTLQFRWPPTAEARVTQATVDHFGNFSLQYRLRAYPLPENGGMRISTSDYRLLYHNRLLLQGRKLDGFDILSILHRLTIPSFLVDSRGLLLRVQQPAPQEIETAFLQNVGSQRAASLRQWYLERRPGDFDQVRARSESYWQAQIPYWEFWVEKWRALFGSSPLDLTKPHLLHLAGLRIQGRTRLIDHSPAPDCPSCIAVAAEDRFSRADLAPYLAVLASRLGLTRATGEAPMTGMRAYVRTEAIIDWQTMLPYRVQAMTITFQDLADGRVASADQTKHFFFEWQTEAAERGTQ